MKYQSYLVCFLCCCTMWCITGSAQTSIGAVTSWKKISGGIRGQAGDIMFEVIAYSPHIVRVRAAKGSVFKPLPYALLPDLKILNEVAVADESKLIRLSTGTINVSITRQPFFGITFSNLAGNVINEDVAGVGFGISFIGDRFTTYKKIQQNERFVGMGEALGNLDRSGSNIALNNTDTYKYGDPRLSMYSSIPFYMGFQQGLHYGIFYNNSYPSFFNFGSSTPGIVSATFSGGDADYFFIYDQSPAKIIEHYTALTGRIQLPPLWSIGYHQSRCSYFPQQQVEWIASTFRSKKIPIDCIVLDADYQYNYQPFRVNQERFPDLPVLAKKLASQQIELTASVYPGVAIDSSYHSFMDGLRRSVFLRYANGSYFNTEIAPVKCYLPDYTSPIARLWWKDKMKWLPDHGIHGYWNDMNEPAVAGSYLPDNVMFDFDGRKTSALEGKNVYGFQMARSSFEAALQNSKDRRPFVLTRSGFSGVQRYAAVWSGDNTASDEGLLSSVLLNNQLGVSGVPFCGHDIGGFIGDGNRELYQRWIQVGVFSPFCRNHKGCAGTAGEPWVYGNEAEAISAAYIGFRYRLLPYLYAAFHEAATTGLPVARSLCLSDPFDPKVYDATYQHQFLWGGSMLVVPVTPSEKQKRLYLPKGDWYNLYTDELLKGAQELVLPTVAHELPVFIKASAIIPAHSLIQSAKELPTDTLVLHVYDGIDNNSFVYYEDAGDGWGYQRGEVCNRIIQWNPSERQLIIGKQEGSYASKFKKVQIVLHGTREARYALVNQQPLEVKTTNQLRLFNPLEALRMVYDEGYFAAISKAGNVAKQQFLVADFDINGLLIELR